MFFPGEFHEQWSLVGYSPWGRRVRYNWVTNTFTFHILIKSIEVKSIQVKWNKKVPFTGYLIASLLRYNSIDFHSYKSSLFLLFLINKCSIHSICRLVNTIDILVIILHLWTWLWGKKNNQVNDFQRTLFWIYPAWKGIVGLGRIWVTWVSLPLPMWTWLLRIPCTEVVNRARSHTLMTGGFNFAFDFPSSLCGVPQKFLKLTSKWCLCLSNPSPTTRGALLVHKQELEKDSTGHRANQESRRRW